MPLGVHTSIAGGISNSIDRIEDLGCDAMQIFSRNPRSWTLRPIPRNEIDLFRAKRRKAAIWPVAVHTTYLINLCSSDPAIFDRSVSLFKAEIGTAEDLGADDLVTHLGSPLGMGADFALERIGRALKEVCESNLGKKAMILLENTSGSGFGFGSSLKDVGRIMDNAALLGLEIGFCFDTCHAFAAGYRMSSESEVAALLETVDREAGLKRLKLIHLNDSKGGLNSKLDRHEHIGEGKIGLDGFKALIANPVIRRTPLILETPKKSEKDDPRNLRTVRKIMEAWGKPA